MEEGATMEHVLRALDEHIAHQDWLLKSARREIEDLRAQLAALTRREDGKDGKDGEEGGEGTF